MVGYVVFNQIGSVLQFIRLRLLSPLGSNSGMGYCYDTTICYLFFVSPHRSWGLKIENLLIFWSSNVGINYVFLAKNPFLDQQSLIL